MKAAATLLRLPSRAGRRRLPAITPPQPRRSLTLPHTHTLRNRLTCRVLVGLDSPRSSFDCRTEKPVMQRECVANEAQAARYRAVCSVCDGEPPRSCATIAAILESI